MRRGGAIVALAVAACSSQPQIIGARLQAPSALAVFAGITHRHPGELRSYLAVAAARGDELRFVDTADDQVVAGPGLVYPLSIPTDSDPVFLAAAPLSDDVPQADLLVAASTGSLRLLVVATWEEANRVVEAVDLSGLVLPGSSILSMAAMGVPRARGPADLDAPVEKGRARVLLGLTGKQLAVVDFQRAQNGAVTVASRVVKQVGFEAAALAVSPDRYNVFAASRLPITDSTGRTALGVAQIETTGDAAAAWAVTVLDALAPTIAVASARVVERALDDPDAFRLPAGASPPLRVYALLDPTGCGSTQRIDCGLATLIPGQGLAPDPAGEMPHRAPMVLPAPASAIAIAMPPKMGSLQTAAVPGTPADPATGTPEIPGKPQLMTLAPATGQRLAPAVAGVPAADGRTYVFDLGRWGGPNDVSLLSNLDPRRTSVTSAASLLPAGVTAGGLGLWKGDPAAGGSVVVDPTALPALIQITPGYVGSETWEVAYQGRLPGLSDRRAVVGWDAEAQAYYLAMQAEVQDAAGRSTWVDVVEMGSPLLAVRVGDIVQVQPDDTSLCATSGETTAVGFLDPKPAFPGGALKLAIPAPGGAIPCFVRADRKAVTGIASVRASGLVLQGTGTGYAGRPELDRPFALRWSSEQVLEAACQAGGDGARLACENLFVARKARRRYYPDYKKCGVGCYPAFPLIDDPLAPGPVVAFRAGAFAGGTVARDASVRFATQSGVANMYRAPGRGGYVPRGVIAYDKTSPGGHDGDGVHLYASFSDGIVLHFSPGQSLAQAGTIQ